MLIEIPVLVPLRAAFNPRRLSDIVEESSDGARARYRSRAGASWRAAASSTAA
jgi:hypothetical protein